MIKNGAQPQSPKETDAGSVQVNNFVKPIWNWPAIGLDALIIICSTILSMSFMDGDWMFLIWLITFTGRYRLDKESKF